MNTKKCQCNIIVPGPLGLFVTLKLTTKVSHMSNLHQIQNMLFYCKTVVCIFRQYTVYDEIKRKIKYIVMSNIHQFISLRKTRINIFCSCSGCLFTQYAKF